LNAQRDDMPELFLGGDGGGVISTLSAQRGLREPSLDSNVPLATRPPFSVDLSETEGRMEPLTSEEHFLSIVDSNEDDDQQEPSLFTEGGLVFLNNKKPSSTQTGQEDRTGVELQAELEDQQPLWDTYLNRLRRFETYPYYGSEAQMNSLHNLMSSFERQERLDVKKPGPWYNTKNQYAHVDDDDNKVRFN